jgi:protein gp37
MQQKRNVELPKKSLFPNWQEPLRLGKNKTVAQKTNIEWTDTTWNPVTGCTKVSSGCDNCYAERFSERFRDVPGHHFETGFDLTLRSERLALPLSWRQPSRVFVNSMSDLFHKDVPAPYIGQVFETMERADWHTFQVLSKRSSRLRNFVNERYGDSGAPPNIWLGVSIEDRANLVRLRHLKETEASVRFVSFEPLIGPIGEVDLAGIHWVIVGGESGPHFRPIKARWIREIREQCLESGGAFFFKQWGGRVPKAGGNTLDGRQWLDYPNVSRLERCASNSI